MISRGQCGGRQPPVRPFGRVLCEPDPTATRSELALHILAALGEHSGPTSAARGGRWLTATCAQTHVCDLTLARDTATRTWAARSCPPASRSRCRRRSPPRRLSLETNDLIDKALAIFQGGRQTRIRLSADVLFAFNKANLSPRARALIAQVAARIRSTPHLTGLRIDGYTDSIGSQSYNIPSQTAAPQPSPPRCAERWAQVRPR